MNVFDDARAVLDAGPVCDACVGRVFADRSHGLTDEARGRALRVALALAADDPADERATDPADCWVCEGEAGRFDEWAERAAETVADVEFDTYQVGTRTPPLIEENERLLREEAGLPADAGETFGSECNREVGKRVGRLTGTTVDFGRPDVQFLLDLAADEAEATINSAFVYGRYRKLEREIPQTEWPCRECDGSGRRDGEPCAHCGGSGYMYEESVEGLTAPAVRDAMDGASATFHGAGREDVDALMLGTGRPFVIEVDAPRRRRVDVAALEAEIDERAADRVEVDGLRLATYETVERVKRLDASKTYRAEVEFGADVEAGAFAEALAELSGATIEQYTPQRVDHRRANVTRTRTAYEVDGELADPRRATVEIHGEGGLYVKELVSGDAGRTEPSLAGLLGVEAGVTALDVIAVEGEDEPFEREGFFR